VFLLYDSDTAGQKATFRAGDELLRHGVSVRVVTLPDGEDPDTFVTSYGTEGLERAIAESIDVFDRKIQILQRGGWFGDLRRKRQALDKLLPTIRGTADRLLRDLYIARTSEVAGVSREMLEAELAGDQRSRGAPRRESGGGAEHPPPGARARSHERRTNRRAAGVRAERELVRVLLHERRYVEAIGERIGAESFTDRVYRNIFTELVSLGPDATIGEIASSFDEETIEELQELLAERGGLDRASEMAEGSLRALVGRELDERLREIDRVMPIAAAEEKDDLIREKERLLREMQAIGRPRFKSFRSPTS